jgi:CPA2 family monovalent cation:H+ antiporter-2
VRRKGRVRGGGMRVGGGEQRVLSMPGGAVLLARVPAHGLEGAQAGVHGGTAMTIGELILFMTISLAAGILLIPRLLNVVAKFHRKEMLLVTVLGLCFGFCLLVIKMEYSVALGAFLIGAIMAESRHIHSIEKLIEPVKDMFIAIFFVTIGLLLDPGVIWKYAIPIALISFTVIAIKVVSCSMGTFITGHDGRTSMRVGMGKAQIGEFSFIIASLGLTLNVTSDFLYPIVVAVSVITTLFTPYLIEQFFPRKRGLLPTIFPCGPTPTVCSFQKNRCV